MWERMFPGKTGKQVARRTVWTVLIVAILVALAIVLAMTLVQTGSDA